ncbi:MAG: hypothetical protein LKF36_15360 [Lactobacillus sp.]|jgi:hypothetical protein|nr:hypothetical protein [Lactobacillus sp.]
MAKEYNYHFTPEELDDLIMAATNFGKAQLMFKRAEAKRAKNPESLVDVNAYLKQMNTYDTAINQFIDNAYVQGEDPYND